jgi:hypothetical protein
VLERFAPQSPQYSTVVRTKRNGSLRHRNPADIFDAAARIYYFDVKCHLIHFAPIAMVHTMGSDLHSRRDQVCEGLSIEEMRHPYSGGDNEELLVIPGAMVISLTAVLWTGEKATGDWQNPMHG